MLRPSLPGLETRYVLVVPAYGEFGTVNLSPSTYAAFDATKTSFSGRADLATQCQISPFNAGFDHLDSFRCLPAIRMIF
jgi:hypothetical protein